MRSKGRARRFAAAVDGIDSGVPSGTLDLGRELAIARLIAEADHSAESAIFGSLRERLAGIEEGRILIAEPHSSTLRPAWFRFPVYAAAAVVLAVVGFCVLPRVPHGLGGPVASAVGGGAVGRLPPHLEAFVASADPAPRAPVQPNVPSRLELFNLTAFHSMQRYPTFEEAQKNLRGFRILVPDPMPEGLILAGVTVTPGDSGCVAMFRGAAGNSLLLWEATTAARRYKIFRDWNGGILTPPVVPEPSLKVPLGKGTAAWMKSEGYGQLAWQEGTVYCQLSGIGLDQETALRIAGSLR